MKGLIIFFGLFIVFFPDLLFARTVVPDEIGRIPVMEYHRLAEEEGDFVRSYENFQRDLEFFYNNGYTLITVSDFIHGRIDVPAGRKPLIFTFDDSTESQFRVLEDGTIDPLSAIGIMDVFYAEHPDFGRSAVFYTLQNPFGQPEYYKMKLRYLLDTDREIGNHTLDHDSLAKMDILGIQKTLGGLQQRISELLGEPISLKSLAYPYGAVPKGDVLSYVAGGEYNEMRYTIEAAFLVGADPAYPPYHTSFEALAIPRIQASDGEFLRWFGRASRSTAVSEEVFRPFVSDGDARLVSVREENMSKVKVEAVPADVFVVKSGEMEVFESSSTARTSPREVRLETTIREVNTLSSQATVSDRGSMNEEIPDQGSLGDLSKMTDTLADQNSLREMFFVVDGRQIAPLRSAMLAMTVRSFPRVDSLFAMTENLFLRLIVPFRALMEFQIRPFPDSLVQKADGYYYTVQSGDTFSSIAQKFLSITRYYLRQELTEVLSENVAVFSPGQEIRIPGVERIIYDFFTAPFDKKGIYWTGYTAGSSRALELIFDLKKAGGNMVIFDIKETAGEIFYDSKVPLAVEIDALSVRIPDLPKLVRILHQNGIYAVARQTVFRDAYLAQRKSQYSVQSRSTGGQWHDREGISWADPSHPDVQAYNIDIAKEVAKLGVDEIQFDYIRFPTDGRTADATYFFEKEHPEMEKYEVIADFLEKAREALRPYDVKLGIDVYGITAWNGGDDFHTTGQKIEVLAEHVDVVYPMVYPSHFGPGFGGHKNPADEPYFFVQESVKQFQEIIKDRAEIVPWIQGFPYRTTSFGTFYVREQIDALQDIGVPSFAVWSAANVYTQSLPAF